ncbi:hypothetical protein BST81_04745 [Leptolyngbya sp. 'hensonii']|uniref:hypothetical protein n=1 Tax=Leptolyngbya sp. 'hensonii' TaxID=1922337 RepID=UPI00094FAAEB|nr:hypothetical protein [Leptolyngbya sp. 'hensonii']OLP19574.1 hypothetical protein BST81_04745 [Leptolyngbya sp. 'hensonii']
MVESNPVEIYCSIPIYYRRIDKRTLWLQWQREEVRYGVPVTTLEEALDKARVIIDATLELERVKSAPFLSQPGMARIF